MEKTTVYLTRDLQQRLKARSQESGRPEAQLIREALAEYLVDQQPELPRSIGIYKGPRRDDGINASNIKNWVRENWINDID